MVRVTLVTLAVNISKAPLKMKGETLLPATQLYRRLLRVHRKALPIEMRVMGDEYVKAEFRRTRKTDNPLHIVGFLGEWKKYLDFHEAQLVEAANAITAATNELEGSTSEKVEAKAVERKKEGQKLQEDLFEKLSADQLGQLYELLQATKEVWNDPAAPTKIAGVATMPADESIGGIPKGEMLPDLSTKAEEK